MLDKIVAQLGECCSDNPPHVPANIFALMDRKIEQLMEFSVGTGSRIRIVLDNHSAHNSKETRSYLATAPNRFEFIFTPKHGSWLNLVESFFSKLARTLLRGIRVGSKPELKTRIELYLNEVNEEPTVFDMEIQAGDDFWSR